jgi:hypothetical protein
MMVQRQSISFSVFLKILFTLFLLGIFSASSLSAQTTFMTSTDTVTVPQGSAASFQVKLSAQPPADVSVTLARVTGDTDITVQSGGSLTGSWGAVDFNVVSPGRLRIGGWGGALSIPVGSSQTLAIVKLKVTCTACSDGKQSQICIGSFTDDIVTMKPPPGCATFTFRK